jgi:hypothetical protein
MQSVQPGSKSIKNNYIRRVMEVWAQKSPKLTQRNKQLTNDQRSLAGWVLNPKKTISKRIQYLILLWPNE